MNRDAQERVSDELVEWADIIFVMERQHRTKLQKAHSAALKGARIVVLVIPDDYAFMDQRLVTLLKTKMSRWLPVQ
ncbi:hypothetical protein [Erythrobacter insulae]|uniref:hypothetical protein n=1 Tax=Erythrobacter insulae TaxID=2584124 RepID=UPI001F4304F8|nr:hypothetical protein [Erythrobacter insulae]